MTRVSRISLCSALLVLLACNGDGDSSSDSGPILPTAARRASFEMSARVLGPVERDDASDLLITIRETGGVDATLHFIRVTCTNGAQQEWGAQSFVDELGSNVIPANSEVQIQGAIAARALLVHLRSLQHSPTPAASIILSKPPRSILIGPDRT